MRELLILLAGLAMLDVCLGWRFSATQNLTITPYKPSQGFYPDRIVAFNIFVQLYNGSLFDLGPALLCTYRYPNYNNFTLPIPGGVYNGPIFDEKLFWFNKVIDPCFLVVDHDYQVNFPEAWTNSETGDLDLVSDTYNLPIIYIGRNWDLRPILQPECSTDADRRLCTYYARWDVPTDGNYSKLYLKVEAIMLGEGSPLISNALKSITFRQIGSTSCTQVTDQPTTNKEYSFTIDFSESHVQERIILLQDIPRNASFIVSVVETWSDTIRTSAFTTLLPPTIDREPHSTPHFIELYWPYIVSASISLLLLLSSSIAIIVLKCRRHRIQQREQYENIPDDRMTRDQYIPRDMNIRDQYISHHNNGNTSHQDRMNYERLPFDGDNIIINNKNPSYDAQNLIVSAE